MYTSTVDEKEMKMFDKYSSVWWNGGYAEVLEIAGTFYFNYMVAKVRERNWKENLRILDVGCGGGFLAEPLAQHGFCVLGIDVNRSLIEVAKNHAQLNPSLQNLTYKHEAIEEHAVNNPEKYDIVILNFVLQHAKNHEIILNNCIKALKPGGLFLVSTAAKTYWAWLNVIILPELYYGYIVRHGHNWHNFIRAREVEAILRKNQCVVDESKGVSYNPRKKCWSWHGNVDRGFYTLLATKQ